MSTEPQVDTTVVDVGREFLQRGGKVGVVLEVGYRHARTRFGEPPRDADSTAEAAEPHDRDALSVRFDDHVCSVAPGQGRRGLRPFPSGPRRPTMGPPAVENHE